MNGRIRSEIGKLIAAVFIWSVLMGSVISPPSTWAEGEDMIWTALGDDPEGDTQLAEGLDIPGGQPWADITKVEVADTQEFLIWRMTLLDLPDTTEGDVTPDWAVRYEFVFRQAQKQDTEFIASVDVQYVAGLIVNTTKGYDQTGNNRPEVADHWEIDIQANTVAIWVKRSDIGNPPDGTELNTIWVNTFDGIASDPTSTSPTWAWVDHAIDGTVNYHLTIPNKPPGKPSNPEPANGATKVSINATLKARVTDPDGDSMTVKFYGRKQGNGNFSLIGTSTNVPNNSDTSTAWSGLSYSTSYEWYVIANDSKAETKSDVWLFTTLAPGEQINQPPTCTLTASPTSGKAPLTVKFTIFASDPDGSIASWELDFGDGSTHEKGSGNPPSIKTHTYQNPGTDTAKLIVKDNQGAEKSATASITVTGEGGGGGTPSGGRFIPGLEGLALIAVLGIAVFIKKQ